MIKSHYLVHDCETGGLDCEENPITQYAAVILDYKTLKEIDRFECYVQPYYGLKIEQEALKHTMVSMTDINNGLKLPEFVSTLTDFWGQYQAKVKYKEAGRLVSVGHNVQFDHGFLEMALLIEEKNLWDYIHNNFIDTFCLSKLTFGLSGTEKLNLTSATQQAKIKLTDAHGAMNDVEATADLFRFFAKKLRRSSGDAVVDVTARPRGAEFFEFKFGK